MDDGGEPVLAAPVAVAAHNIIVPYKLLTSGDMALLASRWL